MDGADWVKVLAFAACMIGLLLLIYAVEKIANKVFGLKTIKISETYGKRLDRWGRGILLIGFLIAQWYVAAADLDIRTYLYWMTYLALFLAFRAVMEFIFIKITKQYIISIVLLIIVLAILVIVYFAGDFSF